MVEQEYSLMNNVERTIRTIIRKRLYGRNYCTGCRLFSDVCSFFSSIRNYTRVFFAVDGWNMLRIIWWRNYYYFFLTYSQLNLSHLSYQWYLLTLLGDPDTMLTAFCPLDNQLEQAGLPQWPMQRKLSFINWIQNLSAAWCNMQATVSANHPSIFPESSWPFLTMRKKNKCLWVRASSLKHQ